MKKQPYIWFTLFLLICLSLSLALAACGSAPGSTATNSPGPATTNPADPTTSGPTTTGAAHPTTTGAANPATTTAPGSIEGSATTAPIVEVTSDSGKVPGTTEGASEGKTGEKPAAPPESSTGSSTGSTTAAATTAAAGTTAAGGSSASGESSSVYPAPADSSGGSYNQPVYNQNPLKAGAVDDNAKFAEYLEYLQSYRDKGVLPFEVKERYIINVVDSNSRTVANATVKIYGGQTLLFQGKTYSNGQVLFFPRAIPAAAQIDRFDLVVEKNGSNLNKSFQRVEQANNQQQIDGATWTLALPGSLRSQQEPQTTLDLLFLLDSTGSMGGEIRRIQHTISDIAYQITTLPGQPRLRFGLVTYRDRGDSYVTRKYGFTENLGEFSGFLNSISAGGGGDYPESLNEGLHVAVNNMNWNSGEALRLTFLVADAPPHLDYPNDYKYTNELVDAVRQGIKIYTIGASGLTQQGEYVFRQLAQVTLAQYLFVTRGGDENRRGSGGPASNTGINYSEKTLDQIVVGIVRQELDNLRQ
jgi:hypothetical protein